MMNLGGFVPGVEQDLADSKPVSIFANWSPATRNQGSKCTCR